MDYKYYSIKNINKFLSDNNLSINKKLGQNFLINSKIVDIIISYSDIKKNQLLLEIGCGLGCLTDRLIKTGNKVVGFEMDNAYAENLKKKYENKKNFTLIKGDFLKKINEINLSHKELKIFGNIPYNITTPILDRLLPINFGKMYLMMQKEVVERITASNGTKKWGSLSIFCQYYSTTKKIINVKHSSFYPMPKVDSSVIYFEKKSKPDKNLNEDLFFKIVKSIFTSRRKQLLNSLSNSPFINLEKNLIEESFNICKINKKIRGEELDISNLIFLTNEIQLLLKNSKLTY